MSSLIGNGDSSIAPQDNSMARPRVPYPLCPSSVRSTTSYDYNSSQQRLMTTSVEKVGDLEAGDAESKEILKEAKKQLSGFAAPEQQLKCQLGDNMAQLEDVHKQLQQMHAEEEQLAALQREAAASQAELEVLREQLRLAQQQAAQQEHAAAAAAAVTTTAATAGTTTTRSAAGDVDLQLVPAPPFPTCASAAAAAAAANWEMMASSTGRDALSKEVKELGAKLVEVKADGRGTAKRLRAVEGKCAAMRDSLDAFKSAQSTPAGRCERHVPVAPITPSTCPCLPATLGVMIRSQREGKGSSLHLPPRAGRGPSVTMALMATMVMWWATMVMWR
ncbi:hypothetical protein Vafri_19683 [Volvox africanus]|uniref:Uncharacterized protein n=1 Tax=Volvox africanus TaxID=51714 RepID=A0A8J4BPG9_9CHLO|nr:hypothetical protein Vafri_19683 [Volvox africanus]